MLINLVRNGVDAARPIDGRVLVAWDLDEESEVVEIQVLDEGAGVQVGADVFVPFFTTKLGGTGIGLALCRQIADAHSGQVALENRKDRAGCLARVRLPTAAARPPPRN
ncbi:MAG: ATP-binding protein [Luteitalea sp.]